MAYKIDKGRCLSCGACADQCPVGAISEDFDSKFKIDPDCCIHCGGCAGVCPASAIDPE